MRIFIAIIAGLLFGFGMGLSQMMDPARAIGFMDIAGVWDPTLLFVLPGALLVTIIAFRLIFRRSRPFLDTKFYVPTRRDIDRPLIMGAAIFGIGWGISGYCPGPAVSGLTLGTVNPYIFLVSLVAGSFAYTWFSARGQGTPKPAPVSSTPVTSGASK